MPAEVSPSRFQFADVLLRDSLQWVIHPRAPHRVRTVLDLSGEPCLFVYNDVLFAIFDRKLLI